jgi:O-antigen/teichoic acid export membrane protein
MKATVGRVLKLPRVLFALGEASNALTLVLFALLARVLGVGPYGSFMALTAISGILSELVQLGFSSLITRTVAQDRRLAWVELRRALRYQWLMCVPVLVILIGYMKAAHFSSDLYVPGLLIGLSLCFRSMKMTLRGVCRGLGDFGTETLFLWIERGVLLVICVGALMVSRDLLTLALVFFVVRALDFLVFLAVIWVRVDGQGTRHLVSTTTLGSMVSFAVSGLMTSMYYQIDTAMLPMLSTAYDAGIYGALYRFVDLIQVLPRVILVAGFPALVLLWKEDSRRFGETFVQLRRFLSFLGLPALLLLIVFSGRILVLAFGEEYRVGAPALVTLLVAMLFAFHSMLLVQVLKASEHEAGLARVLVITVLFNISLNILLIPAHGFAGAAFAMLLTEVVYYLLLATRIHRARVLPVRTAGLVEVAALALILGTAWGTGRAPSPWREALTAGVCLCIMAMTRPNLSRMKG